MTAEKKTAAEYLEEHGFKITCHLEDKDVVSQAFLQPIIAAMEAYAAQRVAEEIKKLTPSNEQIHEAAKAWARYHSEAPDKDCPDWLIHDYEAGAYFVRQCYGCLNKTGVVEATKDYYPKEFLLWKEEAVGRRNKSGVYLYWEDHYTLDELFDYWKNIKK